MVYRSLAGARGSRITLALAFAVLLLALQAILAAPALAQEVNLAAASLESDAQAQMSVTGSPSATVTTDGAGEALVVLTVDAAGVYSIFSSDSQGVDCDTIGYLYDESMAELQVSDDCHADTNFCICADLEAGTYYLKVTGKELQADASITVQIQQGQALNSLDCQCTYASDDSMSGLELGTWEHAETTEWTAADSSTYEVVGYVNRSVFAHAQENGAVQNLAWKTGLPAERGRFVVMVQAVGDTYLGMGYYNLDGRTESSSVSELDPQVRNYVCGAVASAELGKFTTVPTNWSSRWDAITAGYYDVVGYCERSMFEALGGDADSISWESGLPHDVGDFVIRCDATDASDNPYTGTTFIWTSVGSTSHAGSGKWIVDKKATYDTEGERHLLCAYCQAECSHTVISVTSQSVETGGTGATMADYRIVSPTTALYKKCLTTKTTATVPNTVDIDGVTYTVIGVEASAFAGKTALKTVTIGANVTSIGANAFKGCTKLKKVKLGKNVATIGKNAFKNCKVLSSVPITAGVKSIGATAFSGCKKLKTLTVKTGKLTKAGVKKCLKGSAVSVVKVPKAKKKAYAKLFVKKVCGKQVTVK